MEKLKGHLLIAHPNLRDRMFTRSVVLMIEHESTGSIGVVLNKPSTLHLDDFIKHPLLTEQLIHCGGPINEQAVTMLHDDDWYSSNTYLLQRGLAVSSDEFMIEKLKTGNEPRNYRIFTGMSGWAPGQLEAEIGGTFPYTDSQRWLTTPADRAIVFEYNAEKQWERALEQCKQKTIASWF